MREEVIKKIRISHDSNRFKDISLINAKFKVFDHPYSNPWEVNLKTKDIINVDTYAKIQFLIEGYQYYSEGTVFVSLESINENSDIRTFVFEGNSELLPL